MKMTPKVKRFVVAIGFVSCLVCVLPMSTASAAPTSSNRLWVLLVTILHPPDRNCLLDTAPLEATLQEMREAVEAFSWLADLTPTIISLSDEKVDVDGLKCDRSLLGDPKSTNESLTQAAYDKAKTQVGRAEHFLNPDHKTLSPIKLTEDSNASPIDLLPTNSNIQATMKRIAENAKDGDQILVFLSGHAYASGRNDVSLLPTKTVSSYSPQSNISLETHILQPVSQIPRSRNVSTYIFTDACREYKGDIKKNERTKALYNTEIFRTQLDEHSAYLFFSSTPGELSYVNRELQMGYFTQFLSEGLKGAADNGDGKLTAKELIEYINAKLKNVSDNSNLPAQRAGSLLLNEDSKQGDRLSEAYLYQKPVWQGRHQVKLFTDIVTVREYWDTDSSSLKLISSSKETLSEQLDGALRTHFKIGRSVERLRPVSLSLIDSYKTSYARNVRQLVKDLILKKNGVPATQLQLQTDQRTEPQLIKELVDVLRRFGMVHNAANMFCFAIPTQDPPGPNPKGKTLISMAWLLIDLTDPENPHITFSSDLGKAHPGFAIEILRDHAQKKQVFSSDNVLFSSALIPLFLHLGAHSPNLEPIPHLVPWCTIIKGTATRHMSQSQHATSPFTNMPEASMNEDEADTVGSLVRDISKQIEFIPGDWNVEPMKLEHLSGRCDDMANPIFAAGTLPTTPNWKIQQCPEGLNIELHPTMLINTFVTPPTRTGRELSTEIHPYLNSTALKDLVGKELPEAHIPWREGMSEKKMIERLGRALGHNIYASWSALSPKVGTLAADFSKSCASQ